jgi:hypothetical protein
LLQLQQLAGNEAVSAFVQRKSRTYHSSGVAIAPMEMIYEGKCDATTEGASVKRSWSRGLMAKHVSITFGCGKQEFEFSSTHPYIGDRFPWSLELANGDPAFVTDTVEQGLDDIEDDFDEPGSKFWKGYHAVLGELNADLKTYCSDN